ncbi:SDR family NAD(P)-dependent oxidoreductase [Novosphingobium sp. G106]|uniref:SDR family NAD(P)-dependent oxidoreductase n=1 Tax=Novosphingobium sp. G106 TaxID=2849500 RepID=UPI001C2D07C1|nr:SDR family NAD(P)-dependent oxidoreductase [Novosphingobium sp. G106]MBV1691632.1 SDR family NAD(P)-dependent oxidoreductase [Novosphingobium sp. G106]
MTEKRFDGRVAVITGAGRGLGRAYAELLASKGAKVVVNDNGAALAGTGSDAGPAREVVQAIKAAGGEAVACTESVTTREGGQAIVDAAMDSFGRIDVLIHNAGNSLFAPLGEISYEDFRNSLDIHLLGGFHVVQPAFRHMLKANYGRIVLTGSIGGLYTMPNTVQYAVSKSGLIGLSNAVSIEGAEHNIRSNIILPGAVTRMGEGIDTTGFPPMGPEMVAPVVGWLAHEDCDVSGELYISVAGRVARAYFAESEGIYLPDWTIDAVAENIDAIRKGGPQWILPQQTGFADHLARSFEMTKKG